MVKLEIGIWAMGIHYHAGESIRVVVSGSNPLWLDMAETPGGVMDTNKGHCRVYLGGEHASHVVIPYTDL
jgi:predicted acyl esterase